MDSWLARSFCFIELGHGLAYLLVSRVVRFLTVCRAICCGTALAARVHVLDLALLSTRAIVAEHGPDLIF